MSDLIGLQMQFFLMSILSGIILLVVYDILRIFRRIIKHSRVMVSIEDILFWILGSIFIFVMMFKQNNGTIRGFAIMGMVIGMFLYNFFLSIYVVNISSKMINLILSVIKKIIGFILTPFKFVFRKTVRFCIRIKKYLVKYLIKLYKAVKISVTKK